MTEARTWNSLPRDWMVANIAFLGLLLAEGVKAFWQIILYRVEG